MSELELPSKPQRTSPWVQFLAILTLCYLVSFIGSEGAMRGLGDWYPSVQKPAWNVPNWLFAPIWTILYGMMGLAAWQAWTVKDTPVGRRANALFFFLSQLLLSGLWPWVFFAFHQLTFATVEIALLWVFVGLTVWSLARIRLSAALLLVPYWLWVSFATCLTFTVMRLNK